MYSVTEEATILTLAYRSLHVQRIHRVPKAGKTREIVIFCRRKGLFSSYILKNFFQWLGNQCSLVPHYNPTVPFFPKSYF